MPPEPSAPQDLARRIIERHEAAADPAPAAVHDACLHVCRQLGRWVGPAGCRGLFGRALDIAEREHPVLALIRVSDAEDLHLEGVGEAVQSAGSAATAAALEALLVELIALLSRFIGEDMVAQLVAPEYLPDAGGVQNRGQEAQS